MYDTLVKFSEQAEFILKKDITVRQIQNKESYPWLLNRHYAKRVPSISFAFGAFNQERKCVGVITYGTPASSPLRKGICGEDNAGKVLELNRLCCENKKNLASILISRSLALLPRPRIIVSFADTEQKHVGIVYQATNFLYTGLSAKRTNWSLRGKEHLHGVTIADMTRGMKDRAKYMRETYGEDFCLVDRPRKHGYVIFLGSKVEKKNFRLALRYQVQDYPK